MKQPLISKHIRVKALRTPLLESLVSYSKQTSSPKKEHVDTIYKVWESFSAKERSSYKNILNLSMNSSGVLNNFPTPKKNLSPNSRGYSKNRPTRGRSSRFVRAKKEPIPHKADKETKRLTINLNKHRIDEAETLLKPKYLTQQLPTTFNTSHRAKCNCVISEIKYQRHASVLLNNNKIFVSCKLAASDLPQLLSNGIFAIVSIGEEPNHLPSIRGGYKNFPFEGNYQKLFSPVFNCLERINSKGNVLLCDDNGKGVACIVAFAFLLKLCKVDFNELLKVLKQARQNFVLSPEEEELLRSFDQRKALIKL